MAYQSVAGSGLLWPVRPHGWYVANNVTVDATGETIAAIGRVRWADGGSHTIDTTGSSKIYLHTGTTAVFDNASSIMRIGIQDVDTTTGQPVRPDGTFDVQAVVTTAANTTPALTDTNSFCAATPTTGTKTIANNDLIAICATFDTVGGSDAVGFAGGVSEIFGGGTSAFPTRAANITGSWVSSGNMMACLLVASDGTYGTLFGYNFVGALTSVAYADASNPDEYGNIFQVPFGCKVNGFTWCGGLQNATSDFQYDLTSTPTGTPASLISGPIAVTAEAMGSGTAGMNFNISFPEVTLSANTDYCISVKATSTGNVTMYGLTLPAAGVRALFPGGTTIQGATRNGGSGAFTGSTTVVRSIGVHISQIDFPSGGGTYFSVGG